MGTVGAMAIETPPDNNATAEEKPSRLVAKFVEVVDARFLEYDKPLLLAVVIGGLTLLLGIIILILQLTTDVFNVDAKSTAISYPQFYGSMDDQRRWYQQVTSNVQTDTEAHSETTTTTELCITLIQVAVPDHDGKDKAMPFWSNVAGTLAVPYLEPCWPGDNFMNGQSINPNSISVDDVWNGDDGNQVSISLCPGVYNTYSVSAQTPTHDKHTIVGGDAIKALVNEPNLLSTNYLVEVTCPPFNYAKGAIPWIAEYKQTVTIKANTGASVGDAIGTAFAYATYIQVFITVVLVNAMLLGNCIKQTSGEGIDDSAEIAEKLANMAQQAMDRR